jgi:Immunity protein 44
MQTKVWTSSFTDEDIGDNCRGARNEIEETLNATIGANSYGALKEWAFIALILGPTFLGDFEEVKKYRKKLQEFEFRLKIDHATFKAADAVDHRKLIMASLLRSIDEMRKLVPKGIDYDRLESDVRCVAAAKGWLPDASHHAAAAERQVAPPPPPENPAEPAFKRLYKRIDGVLYYESVGARAGIAVHHRGKVGTKGKLVELPYAAQSPKQAVETFLAPAVAKGFTEMPENHQIEIKYAISGFGETEDLEKVQALEEELDELLSSLGLGFCDGNSIGSDTMEVSCFVVDADIAIKCIKKNLKGTRFADYATMHVVERDVDDDEEHKNDT